MSTTRPTRVPASYVLSRESGEAALESEECRAKGRKHRTIDPTVRRDDRVRYVTSCRICHNSDSNKALVVREMMYGSREEFTYIECARCGCVQIAEIPVDLARFYPPDYYSFAHQAPPRLMRWIKRTSANYALGSRTFAIAGTAINWIVGTPRFVDWTTRAHVNKRSAILEVGAGNGQLLSRMADAGFENVRGIDPFVSECADRVKVEATPLSDVKGAFDLVMFHHSYEHVGDPEETLRQAAALLRPGGCVLIRIPVVGGYAWRTYGANWVQLDAPRHLHLHTLKSIGILAERVGLAVESVVYDSVPVQFWGSERYQLGLSLNGRPQRQFDEIRDKFSRRQRVMRRRAAKLNSQGDGDQAAFYLRRTTEPAAPSCRDHELADGVHQ